MKQLHYQGIYHHLEEKYRLFSVWLSDETGAWGLRLPLAREDSGELALLKKDDNPSISDALSPNTLPFLIQLLQATRTQVRQVEIRALPQFPGAFYGVVTLENDERTFELTARKGLLIALALRCRCPLLITEELLEEKGVHLPAGTSLEAWLAEEEQARLYLPIMPVQVPSVVSPNLKAVLQQGQPLTDQQKQQVREDFQQNMTVQQMEKFKQLWKDSPEFRQRSTEMWNKLGFDGPPVPEGLLDSEDEEPR
jgi:bifunctional DNase/RNase